MWACVDTEFSPFVTHVKAIFSVFCTLPCITRRATHLFQWAVLCMRNTDKEPLTLYQSHAANAWGRQRADRFCACWDSMRFCAGARPTLMWTKPNCVVSILNGIPAHIAMAMHCGCCELAPCYITHPSESALGSYSAWLTPTGATKYGHVYSSHQFQWAALRMRNEERKSQSLFPKMVHMKTWRICICVGLPLTTAKCLNGRAFLCKSGKRTIFRHAVVWT